MISRFEAVKSMVFAVIYFVNTEKQRELKKLDEKTTAKRCFIGIFAYKFSGVWFWFPLWIFGNVTDRNYSGTIRTEI